MCLMCAVATIGTLSVLMRAVLAGQAVRFHVVKYNLLYIKCCEGINEAIQV